MGPPEDLVLLLKRALNLSIFVETGTFQGNTAVWAANHFDRVFTIENSKTHFDAAIGKHKDVENIEFLFGDSRSMLKSILTRIHEPALFWLDAHWCGMGSYGSDDQCPIIEEIGIIRSTGVDHCILIDDARLFLSPPPLPNNIGQWPTIDELCRAIQIEKEPYYMVIFEDVIVSVSNDTRSLVANYCQAANTRAWNEHGMIIETSGLQLVKHGVWVTTQHAWLRLKQLIRP